MSIVTANQNIRKKEEEEEKKRQEQSKVVGQQQKTQSNSNKPVGSTSIPKDNQQDSRTQKSAASSLRQEPKKEESKQNIIRRNTFTANKEEQKQNNTKQNHSRQSENKKPVFTDFMGNDLSQQKKNTGTWGYNKTVDDARSKYAMSLKDRRQNLDEANSLPTAEEFQRSKMSEQERVKDLFNKDLGSKTKQQGPTVISGKEFTKSDHNTLSAEDLQRGVDSMTPEVLQQWLSPGVQLDRDAKKIAKEYARQEREKFNIGANHVPELNSAEDEAKYRDLMSLANKSSPLASFMTGFIDPFYKTAKVGTDAIANNFMDEAAKQQYYQSVENQKSAMQNAQVQNPKLTGAGELAGNATEYAVTEPLVGLVAGALGVTGKAANFVVNQLANAGQDALLSWAPTLNELSKRNDLTPEEKTNTLLKTIGLDVGGNLVGAGVSAGLGNLLSKSAKNAIPEVAETATKEAIPDIAEQAVKETVPQTAEQIIKEASPEVVEQAAKEAAQQTAKEAAPEVVEDVVKNAPEAPIRNYLKDNEFAKNEMDNQIRAIDNALNGDRRLDNAWGQVIESIESDNADDVLKALDNLNAEAKGLGYDVSGNVDSAKRIATGETAKNVGEDIFDNTVKATDNIKNTLNKYSRAEMSDKAKTEFASAIDELAAYKEAVMTGGDVKEAGRKLNNTLGRLDRAMKGVEGYEGEFNSKTFKDQLSYNTYLHGKQNPIISEDAEADKIIQDWIDNEGEAFKSAKPANQIPGADDLAENAPKQIDDIAESTVKNTDNVIPDIEEPKPKAEAPKTEKVDRGPEELLVDDGTKRERGYARSTRNNPDIPDDVAAEFVDNPEIYNVLHNKDTKAKAQSILDQGFDKAYTDYKDLLNRKDPAAVPLGYDLAKQMIDNGDSSGAADLIRDMSKSLTESGQFSQAAAITLMKNDPMTALRYAEKELDSLNTEGAKKFGKKWNDFKLTDDEIKAFSALDPGDKEGIAKLFDQIGTRLGKEYPTTAMEKLLEARRIGMLFNVRTNVRNFGANVPTLGMRWASDRVDAVGQNIAHIINPDFKVTQSLTGSGKEGRKLATEVFDSDKVQALLKNTDGKYADSVKGALVKEKQMYKGTAIDHWIDKMTGGGLQKLNEKAFGKKGVQSIPETIRNATYKALELGDSPFVKENFVERLGSYIKAQGYKSIDEIPDEAIETAWESAMKATYKDQSWAYKMIRDIKNGIGQAGKPGKIASESLIPFVQAPGNIAARMVDYSPIGGANGIRNIIKGAKSGSEKTVREGINQLAQGATGSLALGIGIALHNSGLITGGYSQDKDKKSHEKNNGFREYALHIGDKYYTIDWAQPAFQSLMTGVLLADAINKSDEYDSDLLNYFGVEGSTAGKVIGGSKEAAKTTLNAWFNASPLQSMQDLLGGTYEDSSDIASKLWSVGAENFAGSYVPASVNAIAKTADRTQRQTYDPSSKTASFVNQQIAKIPGVSKMLPAKYNTWGEEIKTADSAEEAAFNRFVNPGEGTTENKKPIDKELDRLFDATGNNAVYPQVAPNNVNNEALTAKQVSELQKDMGEQSYQAATKFMDSDVYKDMTDEQKAEGYSDLYTTVKWAAQLKLTDPELYKKMQDGDEEALSTLTGNGASMKKAYITGGIDTVLDGMKTDAAFDKAGINKSEKAKAIYEAEGEEGLMKYAEQKKTFDAVGAPETDKAKEIYEAEGEEGLERYTQYYNAAKEASGGESVTTAGIVEALKDESPEVQKEMMDNLMSKQADAATKANESYSNGAYKYYKYKTEADTDGNGRISADESHAYFDALDIPGTEKAYFDKAIRNNAKTSIYDGTAKKGTNKSTAKTSTNKPTAQATGDSTFGALMKSKQKARDSYASSPKTDNTIPDVGSSGWELSNGYNLKNTQTYQRAQAAGVSDNDFLNAWNAADADGNGYIKKAEAQAYVNALPKDEQSKWYNILYKSRSKKKK